MSEEPILTLPSDVYTSLWTHLTQSTVEEAAFGYVRTEAGELGVYHHIDWYAVPHSGFVSHSSFHLELTDHTRALVIKRAHDLGASLVELHSHTGHWPAAFSASDVAGFREFVPHVWWRLKGRPYLAVVVGRTGFDALAWISDARSPVRLGGIRVDGEIMKPTGLSVLRMESQDES